MTNTASFRPYDYSGTVSRSAQYRTAVRATVDNMHTPYVFDYERPAGPVPPRSTTFVVVSGPRGTSPVTSESDTTHRETVTTMKAAGWRVMADYRVSTYLLLGEYAAAHVITAG